MFEQAGYRMPSGWHHLTGEQRYRRLGESGLSRWWIMIAVEVSPSTVSRYLRNNGGSSECHSDEVPEQTSTRRHAVRSVSLKAPALWARVEGRLQEDRCSLEPVAGVRHRGCGAGGRLVDLPSRMRGSGVRQTASGA